MNHVSNSVRSFISNSLITSRLLSQASFDEQLSNLLRQAEAHIPTSFAHALEIVQSINHANALMTIYRSNYEFFASRATLTRSIPLYTRPITYQGPESCSCGLQSKCLRQAVFNEPQLVAVKGLLVGCLPSESLLASTLECFFDIDCINLIRKHTSGNVSYLTFFLNIAVSDC